jgi:GntR family transcriptional regulator/MocR family aminotransferase
LRIGYIAAPEKLVDALAHSVSLIDGMGNTLTEEAAAELIEDGELRRHTRKVTHVYAGRRQAFAQALDDELGGIADYRMPGGGLAFWLRFPDSALLDRIEARAPALGVRFADSRSFAASEDAERGAGVGVGRALGRLPRTGTAKRSLSGGNGAGRRNRAPRE